MSILGHMAALSARLVGPGNAARRRVGLLTLVVVLAASISASAKTPSAGADARKFVDAHNAVRAAVQRPANYPGPWSPVPPVAWSDEIAGTAQAWAEHLRDTRKCGLLHSDTRDGESLAAGRDMDAERAVRMWAGEIGKYEYSPIYEFEPRSGHYSQIVWRKTTHIGCGRANCGRDSVVVCRYSPAGNRIGKAPY
jgi:pathogenesis-related protein 1